MIYNFHAAFKIKLEEVKKEKKWEENDDLYKNISVCVCK